MDFPLWLWAVPVGSFAVLEGVAIFNRRRGDTASELLRKLAGIRPLRPWKPTGVAVISALCAWLAHHIIGG